MNYNKCVESKFRSILDLEIVLVFCLFWEVTNTFDNGIAEINCACIHYTK